MDTRKKKQETKKKKKQLTVSLEDSGFQIQQVSVKSK